MKRHIDYMVQRNLSNLNFQIFNSLFLIFKSSDMIVLRDTKKFNPIESNDLQGSNQNFISSTTLATKP